MKEIFTNCIEELRGRNNSFPPNMLMDGSVYFQLQLPPDLCSAVPLDSGRHLAAPQPQLADGFGRRGHHRSIEPWGPLLFGKPNRCI